jgi:hypothetical protein
MFFPSIRNPRPRNELEQSRKPSHRAGGDHQLARNEYGIEKVERDLSVRREAVELCESETIVGRNGVGEKVDGGKHVGFLLRKLAFGLEVGSIG